MNKIKGIALGVTLGVHTLSGCSGSSTVDPGGSRDQGGTIAGGGSGGFGGGASGSGATNVPVGGNAVAGTSGGLPPISIACQSAGDCDEGQICCSETMKVGTVCQASPCETTLLGYPLQFCASDEECVTAGQCVATTVAGNTIRICRPGTTTSGTTGGAPGAGGTPSIAGASGSPDAGGAADAAGGASGASG